VAVARRPIIELEQPMAAVLQCAIVPLIPGSSEEVTDGREVMGAMTITHSLGKATKQWGREVR
jgi:hypothetical protein